MTASYMDASRCLQSTERSLFQLLNGSTYSCEDGDDVALVKSMRYHEVPKVVIDAVIKHYEGEGIDVDNTNVHMTLSENHYERAERLLAEIDLCDQELVTGLSSYHWLMSTNPSANLISVLSRYPPGSTLSDKNGWYWVR